MQRVMYRPWQAAKRPSSKEIRDQRTHQFELKDFLELSAEYDRRIVEIGRLMRRAGSDRAKLRHRIEELMKQQLECSNRIREVIRCMMGWCY